MLSLRPLALVFALAALLTFSGAALADPPGNDVFDAAITLVGEEGYISGSNIDGTKETGEPAHAGNAGGSSVWFRWTASRTSRVAFETCGSELDTLLAVYTGNAVDTLTQVASSDDVDCGTASRVRFLASAGTEYRIAIDGKDADTGLFELVWVSNPANDDRSSPQSIGGNSGSVAFSNVGATGEPGEPEHGGPGGSSIWFFWVPVSGGAVAFDTCDSDFDTLLAVYVGDSTTPLAANDDYEGCDTGSRVAFAASPTTAYLIAVDGYEGDWGEGQLRWTRSVAPVSVTRPTIDGIAQEGQTLTATEGEWVGTAPLTYAFEWALCDETARFCRLLAGTNERSYTPSANDVGARIRVFVTATNGLGSATANSAATSAVARWERIRPRNTSPPLISGNPIEGQMLSTTFGTWEAVPAATFVIRWLSCDHDGRNCAYVVGQTMPTLLLGPATLVGASRQSLPGRTPRAATSPFRS